MAKEIKQSEVERCRADAMVPIPKRGLQIRIETALTNPYFKTSLIMAFAALSYTGLDIMAKPLYTSHYEEYFLIWQALLVATALKLWKSSGSKLFGLSLIVFAWNGGEDALYYFLQLQHLPDYLPWLTSPLVIQPGGIGTGGTELTTIFGFSWGLALMILSVWRISKRTSKLPVRTSDGS